MRLTTAWLKLCAGWVALGAAIGATWAESGQEGKLIWAASEPLDPQLIQTNEAARIEPVRVEADRLLWIRLTAQQAAVEAKFTVRAPEGNWDLSAYEAVVLSVRNISKRPTVVYGMLANPEAHLLTDCVRGAVMLMPGQSGLLKIRLTPRPPDPTYEPFRPFYMYVKNINVRDNTIDPKQVVSLSIWIEQPESGQTVEVGPAYAQGQAPKSPESFFPFVDEYGQYIHSDWPGKIYSDADFPARLKEEEQEMADWPGPADWNQYGGWATGPRQEAKGFFYVKKVNGKWWLVDPEGCLFWSYGPTGVGYGGDISPITDREHWFRNLPEREGPLGRYYREGRGAMYRYYHDKAWLGFDFAMANTLRKYGPDYEKIVPELCHRRLRSWGFNTIANWSARDVYLMRRTPYTVAIHYGGPWMYRLPDVFSPDFEKAIRERMERERGTTANDPWNIGYFVDNELVWGWRPRAAAVGEQVIQRGPETASKKKFVEMLQARYRDIQAFNQAWGREHTSWEDLLESTQRPNMDNKAVLEDCGDFGMAFAEQYFRIVRDAVKSVAPNNLYLGCRFHGHIDPQLVALAFKYCDVISYNIYDNPPHRRADQYRNLDVPILSSEWGVGSDPLQTPFRGDRLSHDPRERAEAVQRYFESAIQHPLLVGAHFFQYRDQPISGRPDGEAVLRGFVNITDTPHFDLVQINRRLGYNLYSKRFGPPEQTDPAESQTPARQTAAQ